MRREEIVTEARRWLGVPWRARGRNRLGLDCLGLGIVVADAFGVAYEDSPDYSNWPDPQRRILAELHRWLRPVPPYGFLTGYIGVFAEVRLPGHIGFLTWKHGCQHVLHARIRDGVTEEPWRSDPTAPGMRLVSLFAFNGIED